MHTKSEKQSQQSARQRATYAAFRFFYANAGTSYNPSTETKAQGKARGARRLAKAERMARELGYRFTWQDDWTIGSHVGEFGKECYEYEPGTCESCIMLDQHGNVVQSLGCIDDATNEYRRVIEAELALEELG